MKSAHDVPSISKIYQNKYGGDNCPSSTSTVRARMFWFASLKIEFRFVSENWKCPDRYEQRHAAEPRMTLNVLCTLWTKWNTGETIFLAIGHIWMLTRKIALPFPHTGRRSGWPLARPRWRSTSGCPSRTANRRRRCTAPCNRGVRLPQPRRGRPKEAVAAAAAAMRIRRTIAKSQEATRTPTPASQTCKATLCPRASPFLKTPTHRAANPWRNDWKRTKEQLTRRDLDSRRWLPRIVFI